MADMVLVYRMLLNMCEKRLKDVGLSLSSRNERSSKQRLYQRRAKNRQSGTFRYNVPSLWNKLPSRESIASSLKQLIKKSALRAPAACCSGSQT